MKWLAITLLIVFIEACVHQAPVIPQSQPVPEKVAVPSPTAVAVVPVSLDWNNKIWDMIVRFDVTQSLVSFNKASDISRFCPGYSKLDQAGQIEVWSHLIVAIAKYESDYSPYSNMVETTQGIDPSTGLPKKSEGLLQLSYQDRGNYSSIPECQLLNWSKDKSLDYQKRSIVDPKINLDCGIKIMAHLVSRDGLVADGHAGSAKGLARYWSVVRTPDSYGSHKLNEIIALTKKAPGC